MIDAQQTTPGYEASHPSPSSDYRPAHLVAADPDFSYAGVLHDYPDPLGCTDGRTLIIRCVANRGMRAEPPHDSICARIRGRLRITGIATE